MKFNSLIFFLYSQKKILAFKNEFAETIKKNDFDSIKLKVIQFFLSIFKLKYNSFKEDLMRCKKYIDNYLERNNSPRRSSDNDCSFDIDSDFAVKKNFSVIII